MLAHSTQAPLPPAVARELRRRNRAVAVVAVEEEAGLARAVASGDRAHAVSRAATAAVAWAAAGASVVAGEGPGDEAVAAWARCAATMAAAGMDPKARLRLGLAVVEAALTTVLPCGLAPPVAFVTAVLWSLGRVAFSAAGPEADGVRAQLRAAGVGVPAGMVAGPRRAGLLAVAVQAVRINDAPLAFDLGDRAAALGLPAVAEALWGRALGLAGVQLRGAPAAVGLNVLHAHAARVAAWAGPGERLARVQALLGTAVALYRSVVGVPPAGADGLPDPEVELARLHRHLALEAAYRVAAALAAVLGDAAAAGPGPRRVRVRVRGGQEWAFPRWRRRAFAVLLRAAAETNAQLGLALPPGCMLPAGVAFPPPPVTAAGGGPVPAPAAAGWWAAAQGPPPPLGRVRAAHGALPCVCHWAALHDHVFARLVGPRLRDRLTAGAVCVAARS